MTPLRIFIDLKLTPELLTQLESGTKGHKLVLPLTPIASSLSPPVQDPQFSSVDIAFGQPDLQSIAGARNLRWIHISTAGITRYDTPSFRASMAQRNIVVSNSSSVYDDPCATQVMSFILAQARNLPQSLAMRLGNAAPEWLALRRSCIPLNGQTVLIVGYGAIGNRLADMLAPHGVKLIAYRRKPRGDEGIPVISGTQLSAALSKADHVVNILPESQETGHFFNAAKFAAFKPGAVFYNIGRGTTVDQNALVHSLNSGQLAAAWLDVTDPEPLPEGHPLLVHPNCFITPHVAGGHFNELGSAVSHFLENFRRFTSNESLLDRVM